MKERIHLLLVEDNEGDIFLTKEALRDRQTRVELSVVRDGESAIRFLNREDPFASSAPVDLVLLDINLPRVTGIEVLEHIKNSETLRRIPVVMLSTSSSPDDVAKSYHKQANCYIIKPAEADEFLEAVRSLERFWLSVVQLPDPACN